MSVTQNYTITMSSDAMRETRRALLVGLLHNRKDLTILPITPEYADFVRQQIAIKLEATAALDVATATPAADHSHRVTNGMCEGEARALAAIAVRFLLHVETIMSDNRISGTLADAMKDQLRVIPNALRTALLFLENPK